MGDISTRRNVHYNKYNYLQVRMYWNIYVSGNIVYDEEKLDALNERLDRLKKRKDTFRRRNEMNVIRLIFKKNNYTTTNL